MNLPSIKTLQAETQDRDQAKTIRALLEKKLKTSNYQSVQDLERQCYHAPGYAYRLMTAINEIMGGYGVEAIFQGEEPRYEYINLGETYATTIMRNVATGRVFVSSWGDVVERDRL